MSCDMKMSTTFHPRTVGDMFRYLVKTASDCELVLFQAEFAYNNLLNRSTGSSPFNICTVYDAFATLDLAPLPPMFFASATALEFLQHLKEVHDTSVNNLNLVMLLLKPHLMHIVGNNSIRYGIGFWPI